MWRWIVLCVGIAAADGNSWGVAAQKVEAGISSSKAMAAAPATSASALRYAVRRSCRRRRSGNPGSSARHAPEVSVGGVGSSLFRSFSLICD